MAIKITGDPDAAIKALLEEKGIEPEAHPGMIQRFKHRPLKKQYTFTVRDILNLRQDPILVTIFLVDEEFLAKEDQAEPLSKPKAQEIEKAFKKVWKSKLVHKVKRLNPRLATINLKCHNEEILPEENEPQHPLFQGQDSITFAFPFHYDKDNLIQYFNRGLMLYIKYLQTDPTADPSEIDNATDTSEAEITGIKSTNDLMKADTSQIRLLRINREEKLTAATKKPKEIEALKWVLIKINDDGSNGDVVFEEITKTATLENNPIHSAEPGAHKLICLAMKVSQDRKKYLILQKSSGGPVGFQVVLEIVEEEHLVHTITVEGKTIQIILTGHREIDKVIVSMIETTDFETRLREMLRINPELEEIKIE